MYPSRSRMDRLQNTGPNRTGSLKKYDATSPFDPITNLTHIKRQF